MPDLPTILTFAAASMALLLVPGPAVLYVVNRSVADGRRVGLASVLGVELGSLAHVLAAALGLSAVVAASALAFDVVRWAGAAYLVFLGVRTLVRRPEATGPAVERVSARRALRQGAVVQVLNPKVALFFLSFLPQFVDPDRGPAVAQTLVLGLVFVVLAALSDGAYALAASGLRGVFTRRSRSALLSRYVGGFVYIALGVVAAGANHRAARSTA